MWLYLVISSVITCYRRVVLWYQTFVYHNCINIFNESRQVFIIHNAWRMYFKLGPPLSGWLSLGRPSKGVRGTGSVWYGVHWERRVPGSYDGTVCTPQRLRIGDTVSEVRHQRRWQVSVGNMESTEFNDQSFYLFLYFIYVANGINHIGNSELVFILNN